MAPPPAGDVGSESGLGFAGDMPLDPTSLVRVFSEMATDAGRLVSPAPGTAVKPSLLAHPNTVDDAPLDLQSAEILVHLFAECSWHG